VLVNNAAINNDHFSSVPIEEAFLEVTQKPFELRQAFFWTSVIESDALTYQNFCHYLRSWNLCALSSRHLAWTQ
jgi:hypothetical protein